MSDQKTKLVRINLAAFTRVEYSEVIEVPDDITEDQLNTLVNKRYEDVDGGEFWSDPEYWGRATCSHESADEEDSPEKKLTIKGGQMIVSNI